MYTHPADFFIETVTESLKIVFRSHKRCP